MLVVIMYMLISVTGMAAKLSHSFLCTASVCAHLLLCQRDGSQAFSLLLCAAPVHAHLCHRDGSQAF